MSKRSNSPVPGSKTGAGSGLGTGSDHGTALKACPLCGSARFSAGHRLPDPLDPERAFTLMQCPVCSLLFTQPPPDPGQIKAYYSDAGYVSHSETAPGIRNRFYYQVRRWTVAGKRRLIRRLSGRSSGTLLDYGCGTGYFAAAMAGSGWEVTGLEPDAGARAIAAGRHAFRIGEPGELFELPTGFFDVITLWHVLEHIHALHETLSQLTERLKPDGHLLIALPNIASFDARFYREAWAAYDVPRHLYHFSPEAVRHLAVRHGLDLAGMYPMWFDAFYIALLSSGRALEALGIGLWSNLRALFNIERCSSIIYHFKKGGPAIP